MEGWGLQLAFIVGKTIHFQRRSTNKHYVEITSYFSVVATSYFSVVTTSYFSFVTTSYFNVVTTSYFSVVTTSYFRVVTTSYFSVVTTSYFNVVTTSYFNVETTSYFNVKTSSYFNVVTTSYFKVETTSDFNVDSFLRWSSTLCQLVFACTIWVEIFYLSPSIYGVIISQLCDIQWLAPLINTLFFYSGSHSTFPKASHTGIPVYRVILASGNFGALALK